ncbi:uncharacterized protein LOC126893155 [Diabrotica virgifera virgifera]|uniref:Transposase Tc1-like domain-containing protein n=1 Tax=Diabrotica virgifera virgifera TaxID=50390 RepID=A0ABM5L9F3_DIAVI|nr:uncharacterized protein LOC126893155 [Diabrotica virgifera virgifera]
MARGKPTDPKVPEIIIHQYHKGKTMREISSELTVATTTVFNIIKKYGETASIGVRGNSSGCPKAVSQRSVRHLIRICKSGRNTLREVTARWNRETGMNVSRECCRKYIHESGLSFYKAKEKPLLTEAQKRNRYIWAKSKLSQTKLDWDKVIYSDESKFDVCVGDYRKRVIREKTEAFHKDCLKKTVKFPQGIMV